MSMTELDTSNGVLLPFYDPDTNVVYLCGKVIFLVELITIYNKPVWDQLITWFLVFLPVAFSKTFLKQLHHCQLHLHTV